MQAFAQVTLLGIVTGSLYGLLALGIVLIYRTTGVLNFAYGAMAAFCACFLEVLLTGPRLSFWLALALALLFAAALGVVLERLFARPFLNAPIFTKAIATLALALVLRTLAQALWPQLADTQHFPTPFEGHALRIAGVFVTWANLAALITGALIVAVLTLFLTRTRLGIAMRATADNGPAARLSGVPAGAVFLLTWALSAVIAALAAVLMASQQGLIDVQFMDPVLILAFTAAVLGGLESQAGALIGGMLVGVADNWLALFLAGRHIGALDVSSPGLRAALIFGGFVLALLLRPQGLFGRAQLRRV